MGNLEPIGDIAGVDTLLEKVSAGTEESSCHDNDGGGTVSSFDILGLRNFDKHLGGWVDDLHLLEDSGSIICDKNLSFGVLNLHSQELVGRETFGVAEKVLDKPHFQILTILSMPRGPREVRKTSATAKYIWLKERVLKIILAYLWRQ